MLETKTPPRMGPCPPTENPGSGPGKVVYFVKHINFREISRKKLMDVMHVLHAYVFVSMLYDGVMKPFIKDL